MTKSILLSFICAGMLSSSAFAGGFRVNFDKDCRHGQFDAQEGDIEFFNLNIDVDKWKIFQSKTCDITVNIPMRRGYYIVINQFQVEGFADIKKRAGFASLALKHKTSGDWIFPRRDHTRKDDALRVTQKSLSRSSCSKSIQFKTRIEVKAFNALFFQDAAQSQISSINYEYRAC
ncbi:hypothetical protein [Pseudobacteriovorax antillogorgiicola]|uniref:Uncharacterized protein n=1 Tax=Pseudobacteriovorax antillogorgiicola TaxID=1513793 RepID=A0A1Y6BEJ6_9BACT|nr:hypothetical protein [Pseudobacteriovorax antillogorgiicola]TCS57469.1 hypothetical protein EDD56_103209 [Pseudobacteriovorax antillogorgiicola]SMF00622.1 hypothetical protein SAMN06296036_103124 [Pseudobacteriovorax antillogorgiicola]